MKKGISDGALILLIFVMLVSIMVSAGVLAVTDIGSANLTITAVTEINFTTTAVDWGTGYVVSGYTNCVLRTNNSNSAGCTGFDQNSAGLVIENIGSTDVQLNISSDINAANIVGGTSPSFRWNISNSTNSCPGGWNLTSMTEITASAQVELCAVFDATDATDDVTINLDLTIPSDASSGIKSATITATATIL